MGGNGAGGDDCESGLIEVWSEIGNSCRIVVCTRGGLRAVFREEPPTPRPSPATLVHSCTTATVAAQLECDGHRLLTRARDRRRGAHLLG